MSPHDYECCPGLQEGDALMATYISLAFEYIFFASEDLGRYIHSWPIFQGQGEGREDGLQSPGKDPSTAKSGTEDCWPTTPLLLSNQPT